MTGKQSTARGGPIPVAPQMTGKQSTARGPIAPQMTGKQSTVAGKQSTTRAPLAQQPTGMTASKQSTARGPVQPQVTGSKSGKVVPQMTGRSGRTSTTRTGQSVAQPAPRHPGSAVGGVSTTGRAKSPLGKSSVTGGGYQSFGDAMHDPMMGDGGSFVDDPGYGAPPYEGDDGQYPGAYLGGDGNSFAGEGMAYMGEDIGRAASVAESTHTLRNEKKLHSLAGSAVAPSESGGPLGQPFRTTSPAGSRVSHRRSVSGANGERAATPTRSHLSRSGPYEHDHRLHPPHDDVTPTPSEAGIIDRVPDMSERELLEVLKTPRTSYTVSPSVLADEVQRSHYHDEDLCILLHAAEDPSQHDVIRKAVRKAAKMRIRRLEEEVRYDQEMRLWKS